MDSLVLSTLDTKPSSQIFADFQKQMIKRLNLFLTECLSIPSQNESQIEPPIESQLHSAMRYSVFNGGKRLRPLLTYATGVTLGADHKRLDAAAASLELIHCYSLIHDDLPAMDNDILRRGKPTCHVVYGEDIAILAGDALQALAFEMLACPIRNPVPEKSRLEMILSLAKAAGHFGMVGGQALDMLGSKPSKISSSTSPITTSLENLIKIHQQKTGALIENSVRFGILAASIKENSNYINQKLLTFGETLGLLFQVQDDILDSESDTQTLGKTQGKDLKQQKNTFLNLLGKEKADEYLQNLFIKAHSILHELSLSSSLLSDLLHYCMQRRN